MKYRYQAMRFANGRKERNLMLSAASCQEFSILKEQYRPVAGNALATEFNIPV